MILFKCCDIMKFREYFFIFLALFSLLLIISSVSASDVTLETHEFGDFKMDLPKGSNFISDDELSQFNQGNFSNGEYYYLKVLDLWNQGDNEDKIYVIRYHSFSENTKESVMKQIKNYTGYDDFKLVENNSNNIIVYEYTNRDDLPIRYMVAYFVDGTYDDFTQCFNIYGNDVDLIKESIGTIKFLDNRAHFNPEY